MVTLTPASAPADDTGVVVMAGRRPPRRRPAARRQILAQLTPWLFLAAAVGLLLLLTYWPALNLIYYSVTDWDGFDLEKTFVGWDNYVAVFTRPEIFQVFFVSIYYFLATFVQMAIALYFAAILSFSTRFSNLFRGVLFFPYLINGVAIAFMFQYVFQPGGSLDIVLSWVGVTEPPQWLGDPSIANWLWICSQAVVAQAPALSWPLAATLMWQ